MAQPGNQISNGNDGNDGNDGNAAPQATQKRWARFLQKMGFEARRSTCHYPVHIYSIYFSMDSLYPCKICIDM